MRHPLIDRGRSSGPGTSGAAWHPWPGRPGSVGVGGAAPTTVRAVKLVKIATVAAVLVAGGVASAAQPAWRPARPVPIPRTEVAAAALGKEIAVVGGFLRSGANTGRADAYSPARNRWRRLPDLPVTVDHAMAAGVAGRLYVVGGYGPGTGPRNTAFAFHHGHWTPLPSMPAPRAAGGAAIVGGSSTSSAASRRRAGWPATPSPSISRLHAGRRSVDRGLASTSVPRPWAAACMWSQGGPAGSTRTRTSSRHSTRGVDGGGRFRAYRGSAAAPLRRPSVDGCSRPEARSPEERSEPCTPTRRARGAGHSCRTCERRATASALSDGAVARTRSRAARSPG